MKYTGVGPRVNQEMATQYPTCKYIGVRTIGDDVPLDADALKLPNAKFEDMVDNYRLSALQDNSVDVVHMRVQFLMLTRPQWKTILKEAFRVLKPGGVMQTSELLYAVCLSVVCCDKNADY